VWRDELTLPKIWHKGVCPNCQTEIWIKRLETLPLSKVSFICPVCPVDFVDVEELGRALVDVGPPETVQQVLLDAWVTMANTLVDIRNMIEART
jgi:hypothetical protein